MVNANLTLADQTLGYIIGQSRAYGHTLAAQKAELRMEPALDDLLAEVERTARQVERLNRLASEISRKSAK